MSLTIVSADAASRNPIHKPARDLALEAIAKCYTVTIDPPEDDWSTWTVSRNGQKFYVTEWVDGTLRCTCNSGRTTRPCAHRLAVQLSPVAPPPIPPTRPELEVVYDVPSEAELAHLSEMLREAGERVESIHRTLFYGGTLTPAERQFLRDVTAALVARTE